MTKLILRFCLGLLVASQAGLVTAADYNPVETSREGEIHKLDFGQNRMLLQGLYYDVAADVHVEIGGTYGAFTMLQEGMAVEVQFRRFDDGRREIFEIRQITNGRDLLVR